MLENATTLSLIKLKADVDPVAEDGLRNPANNDVSGGGDATVAMEELTNNEHDPNGDDVGGEEPYGNASDDSTLDHETNGNDVNKGDLVVYAPVLIGDTIPEQHFSQYLAGPPFLLHCHD